MRAQKNQEKERRLAEEKNVEEYEAAVCFPASNDDLGPEEEFVSDERRAVIPRRVDSD
jgi:hypothetical protein